MYDKSTPFGRLFVAANELNRNILRHNDLARFLQIDRQQLHNWKSRGIPKARIIDLCNKLNCNTHWLLTGEGPMRNDVEVHRPSQPIDDIPTYNRDDEILNIIGMKAGDFSLDFIRIIRRAYELYKLSPDEAMRAVDIKIQQLKNKKE